MPTPTTRESLLAAAYRCIARAGIARTTLDDVAREAGVSRPTLYRHFPGGRDALVRDVVVWEASRFLGDITAAVADIPDTPSLVEELVIVAAERVRRHEVLQKVVETEPDRLLPLLVTGLGGLLALLRPLLLQALARAEPLDLTDDGARRSRLAADHLARMVLSIVASPGGRDLGDRRVVRSLVRAELLGWGSDHHHSIDDSAVG